MNHDRFHHPWHSLPYGDNAPETVMSIIEIQRGSKAKYELDKESGFLRLDRVLASHLSYPFHYGFIPQTYCDDQDPLDILVLCTEALIPLTIVEATVVGAMKMVDCGQQDDKIISVATHDPFLKHIRDLSDIDAQTLSSIHHFFEEYKKPENKIVKVEEFIDRKQAYTIIKKSIDFYKKSFK